MHVWPYHSGSRALSGQVVVSTQGIIGHKSNERDKRLLGTFSEKPAPSSRGITGRMTHIRQEHSQREGVSETIARGLGERAAQGPIKAMNSRSGGLPEVRRQKFIETPLRSFPRSTRAT